MSGTSHTRSPVKDETYGVPGGTVPNSYCLPRTGPGLLSASLVQISFSRSVDLDSTRRKQIRYQRRIAISPVGTAESSPARSAGYAFPPRPVP